MILAVSHPEDPHAERVLEVLAGGGHDARLLDLSQLGAGGHLTFDYTVGCRPLLSVSPPGVDGEDLAQATAVWWRRPRSADVSTIGDQAARVFATNEWNEAVGGLWLLLDQARWMNDPANDERAARKAHQLRVAVECGLRIPRTLITSDPDQARRFVAAEGLGRTVFKTFSCTHEVWRETRIVREDDLEVLDAVRLAPVIFQEYVPPGVDVRLTVVGDRMFAAAIDAGGTDYPVDFRMSLGQARVEPVEPPPAVAEGLRRMMSRLGLVYGAVDFRRAPDGTWVFFEVNTAGEFLFIEERTGQPITQAVADWLSAAPE